MSLTELAKSCNTDKLQHGYLSFYQIFFSQFQNSNINFLEIGVYRGESARLWKKYFSKANIFMLDVFDKTDILSKLNVHFIKGDSANKNDIERMMDEVEEKTNKRNFDIIIDDGSHFQHDQMCGIGNLFQYLSSDGYYIIEDIASEEDLLNGSQWWGYSGEPHHAIPGECHVGAQIRPDSEWLAGDQIDFSASTDATLKQYIDTKMFNSKYLSSEKNKFITENIKELHYFSLGSPSTGRAKLAILEKK